MSTSGEAAKETLETPPQQESQEKTSAQTLPELVSTCRALEGYELHNWKPDVTLTDDENYMDIVMLLTRTSQCRQGSMGCIIVDPSKRLEETERQPDRNEALCSGRQEDVEDGGETDEGAQQRQRQLQESLYRGIIAAATNASLFQEGDSDIHAEIGALGRVCREGIYSTRACTIYVTMAPCKRCFAALFAAGIHRIVTMRLSATEENLQKVAQSRGMILTQLGATSRQALMERIQQLVQLHQTDTNSKEEINAHRERRKEERRARKKMKRKSKDIE